MIAYCCTGKVCQTRRRAKREARRLSRRIRFPVLYFRCDECGSWHCGKQIALWLEHVAETAS